MAVTPLSVPRAMLSVAPFVGPVFAFYNFYESNTDVSAVLEMSSSNFTNISRDPQAMARAFQRSSEWKERAVEVCESRLVYGVSGMLGNVFSVIGVVSLVALEILSFWPAVFLASAYSFLASGSMAEGIEAKVTKIALIASDNIRQPVGQHG